MSLANQYNVDVFLMQNPIEAIAHFVTFRIDLHLCDWTQKKIRRKWLDGFLL